MERGSKVGVRRLYISLLSLGCILGIIAFFRVFFFMPNGNSTQNIQQNVQEVKQDPKFVELFGDVDKLKKLDTDKDGIPDINDSDIDNDGVSNNQDPDVDNDGTANAEDASTATIVAIAGPQGSQGERGNDGTTGATGEAGAQGSIGPQGQNGVDGTTGSQGVTGPQGPAGVDGATGATGPQGPTGTVGAVTDDGVIDTTLTGSDLDIQLKLAASSGLIKLSGGLSLTNTCSTGQILKWDGSAWSCSDDNNPSAWLLAGNSGTNPSSNFLGTTDAQALVFRTNNSEVARFGSDGNFGLGNNNPSYTLDLTGTFRLGSVPPSITTADSYLVRDPSTGQVSEQTILSNSIKKTSGNVSAGVPVILDNLRVQMSTGGNRSLQLSTVSGSVSVSGTSTNDFISTSAGINGSASSSSGWVRQSDTFTTSWTYWQSGADFPMHGSVQVITLSDDTNNRMYRITVVVGGGYNNNKISIERLY